MAQVAKLARHFVPLADFLYPPRCPCCGTGLANQAGLCADCWALLDIPAAADHLTHAAGGPVPVHAATYYTDISRKLVLAYKHGGKIALSRLLAQLMASRLPPPERDQLMPLLIPVPLHRLRLWGRGFNQAALLAQELANLGKGEALVGALKRHRRTPSLGGLGAQQRDNALRGAIRLNEGFVARITGRDVLLIDDVLTSGATSRACVAAITAACPASIAIACFAQVKDRNDPQPGGGMPESQKT